MRLPSLFVLMLWAAPAAYSQFTYSINPGGASVSITGYTGNGGSVCIPAATNGMPVTSIGGDAFLGCDDLAGVTIPGSVTNLGVGAFDQCASLTNATLSNGVAGIGADAFASCGSLAAVTIPGSVTSIGEQAFSGCSGLLAITVDAGRIRESR